MIHPLRPLARSISYATASSLSLALLAGAGPALLAGPALAAETAAQVRTVVFDVPAGPLDQALGRFGRQAGIPLSTNASLTAGKRSAGVQGRYGVDEGLARLLAGTGLASARQADGSYLLIERGEAGDALEIGATSISGRAALGATTEGSGSYTTGTTGTATRLPLSIRETPQSVTVITRQRMDDQNMNNLDDAVKSTPGLYANKSNAVRKSYFARGFAVDNIMYDGLPTSISTFTQDVVTSADLAIYDRVEVVRGATGLAQGAGNPAAAINLLRKRHTREFQARIRGSAGSWDAYRTEADVSGALNESGSLRGRVVAAYQNKNSFQDDVENERGVLYSVFEADLREGTTLTIGASQQNDNNNAPWGAIPVASDGSDLGLSRSTNPGNKWNYWDQDNTFAFAEVRHQLANDWLLNLSVNRIWAQMDYLGSAIAPVWGRANAYNQSTGQYKYDNDHRSYDLYGSGLFELLGREHELVIGGSYREESMYWHGGPGITATNLDPATWDSGVVPKPAGYDLSQISEDTDEEQSGLYLTTRLSLTDATKLILGGRLDWYDFDVQGVSFDTPSSSRYKVTRNVTRYAGITHDLSAAHTVYASYTDIFKPQGSLGADNGIIKPIEGKNYEIGIKGSYFDGALNASAALFILDQENRAKALDDQRLCAGFALGRTCYEAAGKVRSEGLELELNGALAPNWQVGAGYTYTVAKYREDEGQKRACQLFDTDLPRHLLKLSTTYNLPGALQDWRVGGNVYWQNSIYNEWANRSVSPSIAARAEQDAYAIVDAMVGFKPTAKMDVQLNLNNVFDKKYYTSLTNSSTWYVNNYGEPRNLTLSASYEF